MAQTSWHLQGHGSASTWIRNVVLERDGNLWQCTYCKQEDRTALATEVDHVIPKARGGTDDLSNLQAINTDCDVRKTIETAPMSRRPLAEIQNDAS